MVAQQQETVALQVFGFFGIEMALLSKTQGVYLAVDQGHDMVTVEDNGYARESLLQNE